MCLSERRFLEREYQKGGGQKKEEETIKYMCMYEETHRPF